MDIANERYLWQTFLLIIVNRSHFLISCCYPNILILHQKVGVEKDMRIVMARKRILIKFGMKIM